MTMALAERPRTRPDTADHVQPGPAPVPPGSVSADEVFAGGMNPTLRDALYQWYEQRDITVNVFGPFTIEAVAYARRIAGIEPGFGQISADDAYRRGDCIECAEQPQPPGMLRCTTCHRRYLNRRGEGQ